VEEMGKEGREWKETKEKEKNGGKIKKNI